MSFKLKSISNRTRSRNKICSATEFVTCSCSEDVKMRTIKLDTELFNEQLCLAAVVCLFGLCNVKSPVWACSKFIVALR